MDNVDITFMWIVFSVLSIMLIIIDIWLQNKKIFSGQSLKLAIILSIICMLAILLFLIILWIYLYALSGYQLANSMTILFIHSYFLEQCLAIDNVFVWFLLFQSFKIPTLYQRKVLTCGILGAIIFRVCIIYTGIWLFTTFKWLLYLFGCILIFTGIKIIFFKEIDNINLKDNKLFLFLSKKLRIMKDLSGNNFFLKKNGILFLTPLFVVLIMIEFSDLIFAIDSISAVFSITMNTFIIITSNLLGVFILRSMYFFIIIYNKKLEKIKYGIGIILIYIGFKMLTEKIIYIPNIISFLCIGIILGLNIIINYFIFLRK